MPGISKWELAIKFAQHRSDSEYRLCLYYLGKEKLILLVSYSADHMIGNNLFLIFHCHKYNTS